MSNNADLIATLEASERRREAAELHRNALIAQRDDYALANKLEKEASCRLLKELGIQRDRAEAAEKRATEAEAEVVRLRSQRASHG